MVAVGDTKGYISVFDSESKELKFYTASHKNKVLAMCFTQDSSQLYSIGFDKLSFLTPVASPDSKRELANPNDSAYTNDCCVYSEGQDNFVVTAGGDCALRVWKY